MSLAVDLRSSVPVPVRERGASLYASGKVTIFDGSAFEVAAEVEGSQPYEVSLRRDQEDVLAWCECPYFESNGTCKHVWAALMAADAKRYLAGANGGRARRLIEDYEALDDLDEDDPFELQPPPVPAAKRQPPPPDWRTLLQPALPPLAPPPLDTGTDQRELYYVLTVSQTEWQHSISLGVRYRERKKSGDWGKLKSGRIAHAWIAELPAADRDLLMMLAGTPQSYDWTDRESTGTGFRIEGRLAPILLERMCATGRCRLSGPAAVEDSVNLPPLVWDDGPAWQFKIRLEAADGRWLVGGSFERGEQRADVSEPVLITPGGLLLMGNAFARFEGPGAFRWSALLRSKRGIEIPLKDGSDFLFHMLQQPDLPALDLPEELRYTETTPDPRPFLRISEPENRRGKPSDTLCAFTEFGYGNLAVPMADPVGGVFDGATRVLIRRNRSCEQQRLAELDAAGFRPTNGPYESQPHHHITTKKLAGAVSGLLSHGWHVEVEGRAFRKPVSHSADLTSGIDWFELRAEVDYGSAQVQLPDLLKALAQKSTLVQLSDGSLGMIPEELLEQYGPLLATGRLEKDHLRYSRSQTALLDALLASRPAVSVDEVFVQARERLRNFDRIAPVEQPRGFAGELRGYQGEGLAWMLFLHELGFGGCLADDMGLGKTAQVLALLERRRQERVEGARVGPSLAVVPRSIIFNWKQEAARFTPELRVRDHSGADRTRTGVDFSDADLVLTTYGTLRRDITALKDVSFDYVILDEAQAIKNGGSDTAKAARLLRASHRLAMSGTPIENHIGELFSLFEFLNPGMIGGLRNTSVGRLNFRNPDEAARGLLASAIRPFILRRTKDQVARELPARTEQTVYCELDTTERKLYNELREHYRRALLQRVAQDGIARSQIQILEALLRLRQAACHPGLLDDRRRENGSAKLETLTAQLSEVMSEGHKALVFSQFTSLLSIVRQHLDRDGTVYEYLDGSTRDRQACVERFQSDPACKLFLISLKAGGVGLNLTAAEYVFLLDPWWNPAVEAQAIDRTHRIGQTSRVFAYRLIARDTVEEKVLGLQAHKRELADSIIRADASLVRDLKREDLEFLLS